MPTRRIALTGAGALLAQAVLSSAVAQAQSPASGPKISFQHDLPDLTMKDWAVTLVEVSYAPGQASGAHRHPGITVAYVLEGEIRSKVGTGPEKTYKKGEAFMETPNELHAVSRNASTTQPAKLLAVMFAEKGKPLTVPA